MREYKNHIYFVASETSEVFRQEEMTTFLKRVLRTKVDHHLFIHHWRLGIAQNILENPNTLIEANGLKKLALFELEMQLLKYQVDSLNEGYKQELFRFWFPAELRTYSTHDILLPLSLLHVATLLEMLNAQLVNGSKLLNLELLDRYRLEQDAYLKLFRLIKFKPSDMNVLCPSLDQLRSIEGFGMNSMLLKHYFNNNQIRKNSKAQLFKSLAHIR